MVRFYELLAASLVLFCPLTVLSLVLGLCGRRWGAVSWGGLWGARRGAVAEMGGSEC